MSQKQKITIWILLDRPVRQASFSETSLLKKAAQTILLKSLGKDRFHFWTTFRVFKIDEIERMNLAINTFVRYLKMGVASLPHQDPGVLKAVRAFPDTKSFDSHPLNSFRNKVVWHSLPGSEATPILSNGLWKAI